MSNLVKHARRELELAGVEKDVSHGLVKMVQIFANMGHSGSSAMYTCAILNRLLKFEPLTDLTDNPKEWNLIQRSMTAEETDIWQSNRNPEAFSPDEGKHYYLLSEGANFKNQEPLHESVSYAALVVEKEEIKNGEG